MQNLSLKFPDDHHWHDDDHDDDASVSDSDSDQTSEKPHAWGVQSLFWLRPTRLTCVGRAWGVCLFGRGAKIANLCIKSDEFCLMFDDVGREEWIKSKSKWIK